MIEFGCDVEGRFVLFISLVDIYVGVDEKINNDFEIGFGSYS